MKNQSQKLTISGKPEPPKTFLDSDCRADCKICNSNHREKIHEMRDHGKLFKEIVETVANAGESISIPSLSRHFASWKKKVQTTMIKLDNLPLSEAQAVKISTYKKWTDILLKKAFEQIVNNIDYMSLNIQDLERLTKMRLLLDDGDAGTSEEIDQILEKARKKYNSQSSLFQTEGHNEAPNIA